MAGLRQEVDAVFTFLLFGFTCTFAMSMVIRTIGQTSHTVQQALTPAAIFILALVIYTGYVLPIRTMKDWLRWINYIDPIAYAYESLVTNELSGREFPCTQFVPMGPTYIHATPLETACSIPGALPGEPFIRGDIYLESNYGYYHKNLWR
jgi:ATP-binding cassette, subfamily G (WHITE), member 2, PDR